RLRPAGVDRRVHTAVRGMTGPPGAAVFDLDGPLVDTMRTMPQAYADAILPRAGRPGAHLGRGRRRLARRARTGPAPHFLRRPVTDADLGAYQRHADAAAAAARPFDGVPAMLDALSGAGYRLGPYTSATRRVTTRVLAAAGLAGRSPRRCAAT